MKKALALLLGLLLIASVSFAGSRPSGEVFEPPEHDKGYIGWDTKMWGYGYFNNAVIDTATITSLTATTTRTIFFDLAGGFVDSDGDVDDGSAPNIKVLDTVPAIVWDDSGETVGVVWSFPVPADYSTGMVFYALISSNDASGAATILDWAITQNGNDGSFGSADAQTAVAATSATLDASCEILTLTPDTSGAALFVADKVISLELFNASTNDDDLS